MDFFSQKRLITWIILILVILNISTLSMLWFGFKRNTPLPELQRVGSHREGLRFLKEELNLTDDQLDRFEILRERHFRDIQLLAREIQHMKREIMDQLFYVVPDTEKIDELSTRIAANQAKIEKLTFQHFLQLKLVCKIDQKDKLRKLLEDFFRRSQLQPRPDGAPLPGKRDVMPPRDRIR